MAKLSSIYFQLFKVCKNGLIPNVKLSSAIKFGVDDGTDLFSVTVRL